MIETRHPDVFVIERPAQPRIIGVGTSTGALIGAAEKGPIERPGLVTSFTQFSEQYGTFHKGTPLVHAVRGFFDQGGSRLFVVRVVGAGYAEAEKDFAAMSPEDLPALISGSVDLSVLPSLSEKSYLNLDIDNLGPAPVGIDLSTATSLDGAAPSVVGLINAAVGSVVASSGPGSTLVLTSTTTGPTSEVEIRPAAEPALSASLTGPSLGADPILGTFNPGNHTVTLTVNGSSDIVVDITGDAGVAASYPIATLVSNLNAAIDGVLTGVNTIASASGDTIVLSTATSTVGATTGPTATITFKDTPGSVDARLEAFGVPEGTGDVTITGTTVDAVTLLFGLAEGPTYTATGSTTSPFFMKIKAINPGEWGNSLSITLKRWETSSTEILATGGVQDTLKVSSLTNVRVGDIVHISDGINFIYRHINEIDLATKEIKFLGNPNTGPALSSSAEISSSSTHRFVTELTSSIAIGDTTATLLAASAVTAGGRVVLDDKAGSVFTLVIKSVNGSLISFDPSPATATVGSVVSSMHFDLLVKDEGDVVEDFHLLSVESTDLRDHFLRRLSGDTNESKIIKVEELPAFITDPLLSLPLPIKDVLLEGGLDGVAPGPLEHLGTEDPASGIYLLAENDEFVMFAMPGITDVFVIRSAAAFAERLGRVMLITETPVSDDEPLEALDYRNIELAIDSSYVALYYPWIKIRDLQSANPEALITIPPSGHMMGIWSLISTTVGVHKAPAGIRDGNLLPVFALTREITDGEQDLLNENGVNAIRFFRGQGFKVWGARTLWRIADGFHYISTRRLVNFVKETIKRGNRFAIFEPNDPQLWKRITIANNEFLSNMWSRGMLFPTNNKSKSFFFQCDAETNPISEIKRGRVNCKVGINPPFPAEFIIFEVGLFDGGGDISEGFGLSNLSS